MKPVAFPLANCRLRGAGEIDDLQVLATGLEIVSCWQMTWRERLAALWRGRVWLFVLASRTHPPVALSLKAPEVIPADPAPQLLVPTEPPEIEVLRQLRDRAGGAMRATSG